MPDFRVTERIGEATIDRPPTLEEKQLTEVLGGLSLTDMQRQAIWSNRSDAETLAAHLRRQPLTDDERQRIWNLRAGKTYAAPPANPPGVEALPGTRLTQKGGYLHREATLGQLPPPVAPPTLESIPTDWKQRGLAFLRDVGERSGIIPPEGPALPARARPLEEPLANLAKLVPGPEEERPGQTALGALRGVAEAASGLSSTENVALLTGLGPLGAAGRLGRLASRGVSAYFAAEMAKGTLDTVPGLRERVTAGDISGAVKTIEDTVRDEAAPELARRGAHAVASGLMAVLAGRHAVGRRVRPARAAVAEPAITPEVLPPENLPAPPVERRGWQRVPPEQASVAVDLGSRQLPGPIAELPPPAPSVEIVGPRQLTGSRVAGFEPLREPPYQTGGQQTVYEMGAPAWVPEVKRVFTMGTEPAPVEELRPLPPPPSAAPTMVPGAGVGLPPETAPLPSEAAAVPPETIPRPAPLAQAQRRLERANAALVKVTGQVRKPGMADEDLWDIPRWRRLREEVDRAKNVVTRFEQQAKLDAARSAMEASPGGISAFARAMQKQPESPLAVMPPRATMAPVTYGAESTVRVPGEATQYPVRYAVRESVDVTPSSNPWTFEPHPAYEHTNTRNYADQRNQQKVLEHVAKFDPEFLLTENPTAEHGPPVVDPNGNVLGGNDRSMAVKRVLADRPEAAQGYKADLIARAPRYGLDPARIANMNQPVLVRELAVPAEDPQRAIADFNKRGAAEYTESERAMAGAGQVSARTVEAISSALDVQGEKATMAEALSGGQGIDILEMLVQDGAIPATERASMLNPKGDLTVEAKGRIQKLALGGLFADPDQMDRTAAPVLGKLERAAGSIIRTAGREGWTLLPRVQEALDVLEEAAASKTKNLGDLAKQLDLSGQPRYSEQGVELARALRDEPTAEIGPAFREYAQAEAMSRPGQPEAMFGAPEQGAAFGAAFSREAFRARRIAREKGITRLKKMAANPAQAWLTPDDMAAPAPGDLGTEAPSGMSGVLRKLIEDEGGWSSWEIDAIRAILERDWEGMRKSAARARKALRYAGRVAADYRRVWLKNPDAGWFSRAFDHPMYIAWKHPEFRPVLLRAMEMDHEGRGLAADLAKRLKPYLDLRPEDQHAVDEVAIEARLSHQRLSDMDLSRLTEAQQGAVRGLEDTMDHGFQLMADTTVNLATKGRVTSAESISSAQDIFTEVSRTGLSTVQARQVATEAWALLEHFREQRRAGYVPFSRFGEYHFGVVDKATGKPMYWGAENRLANATTRTEELRQRFQNELAAGTAEIIEPKEKINTGTTLLDGLNGMEIGWISRLAKIDPELGEAFQQQADAFTRRMGFRSHLNRATDVPGFERDLRRSLVDYTLGVSRYVAKSKGLRDMRAAAEKIPVTSGEAPFVGASPLPGMAIPPPAAGAIPKPRLARYAKNYIDYQRDPGYEAQFLRSALFHYYLGLGNVKSAIVNLSQVPMMTGPWLMQYANPGRVAFEIGRAYKDVTAAITTKGLDYDLLPDDVRDAAKASHEAGTVGQQGWQELAAVQFGVHPVAEQLANVSGALFSATEHTNRLVSHIAAQRIFAQRAGSPKLAEFGDARGFAENVVDNTQLAYGRWNRARYTRGKFAPLMVFRSFTKGYMEMLAKLYHNDPKAMSAALGVMVFAAGVEGLPFMQDVEDAAAEVYRIATGDKVDMHGRSHEVAAEVFGAPGADLFLHGISSFSPWDVSASLGMGRIIPLAAALRGDLRGLSAALEVPGRATEGVAALLQDESTRGGELIAPRAVSQVLRAGRYAQEGLRTGTGGQITLPGGRTELTALEVAGQALGFTPRAVRLARERERARRSTGEEGAHHQQVMLRQVATAIEGGDENALRQALDRVYDYNQSVAVSDQIAIEHLQDYLTARTRPGIGRELLELPARKRPKFLEQQRNWPGYEQLAPLPAPAQP